MSTSENSPESVQICPHWRKFVILGDRALALCAKRCDNTPPIPDVERRESCPFFNSSAAGTPAYIYVRGENATVWWEQKVYLADTFEGRVSFLKRNWLSVKQEWLKIMTKKS